MAYFALTILSLLFTTEMKIPPSAPTSPVTSPRTKNRGFRSFTLSMSRPTTNRESPARPVGSTSDKKRAGSLSAINVTSSTERIDEKRAAAKIDDYLRKEKIRFNKLKAEPKVLILGSSDSGKSTLLKQMKIIHGDGFTEEERKTEKLKIRASCLFAVVTLLERCVEFENRSLSEKYKSLSDIYESYMDGEECKSDDVSLFKQGWAEPVIQEKYLTEKHQLPDSTVYFMGKIDEIFTIDYSPSNDDILNQRTVTKSVSDSVFVINNKSLHVIDVSGLSHHRKAWISYFDDVHCVIYIASLSSYDQTMVEEDGVNQMVDSIVLFQEMVNHKLLGKKPFVLFLNKKDLFLKKIKTKRIVDFFPNYKGPKEDANAGIKYFDSKFRDQNAVTMEIVTHITCCTDTNIMKVIVSAVINSILFGLLDNVGLAI